MGIRKKYTIAFSIAIIVSFCAGAASMFYFIQHRVSYMSYGVFIDKNKELDKFGIHSGKDYSGENPYNYVPVDWLIKEVEVDTIKNLYKDDINIDYHRETINKFLNLAMSGKYKIYSFSSNITMWYSLRGVEGYCLVDTSGVSISKWIILTGFITSMS